MTASGRSRWRSLRRAGGERVRADGPRLRCGRNPLLKPPTGARALIDNNPRRVAQKQSELQREALAQRDIGQPPPQARRYRERSTVERVNGRLEDGFGGRRVRGHAKLLWHLMSGIVALTVDQ